MNRVARRWFHFGLGSLCTAKLRRNVGTKQTDEGKPHERDDTNRNHVPHDARTMEAVNASAPWGITHTKTRRAQSGGAATKIKTTEAQRHREKTGDDTRTIRPSW